jgi:hypothetical protein
MPYKNKEDRLAYQRKNYHERKHEYKANPGRTRYRKAGMDARQEILTESMSRFVWPHEVPSICAKYAVLFDVKTEDVIQICTRTLKGYLDCGLFLGDVLFGDPKIRSYTEKTKAEKFKKDIKKKAFKAMPELLILQIELEDVKNGRKSTYDIWRRSTDDY